MVKKLIWDDIKNTNNCREVRTVCCKIKVTKVASKTLVNYIEYVYNKVEEDKNANRLGRMSSAKELVKIKE